jgi:hypothetical protein
VWDIVENSPLHLSHDMPCARCGHALHTFLACSDTCSCEPAVMPGSPDRALIPA